MRLLGDVLRLLSAASLGVFVGANVTEGGLLVPWWRSLAPDEFLRWYAANARRLLDFFSPLTTATALIVLAAALASLWDAHPGRWAAVVAAGLMIVVVASFFIYFQGANASFATGSVGVEGVAAALRSWGRWHWARTALSGAALVAALRAL